MFARQQDRSNQSPEPIALIGIGCRLPGEISNKEGLLSALREGRDLISEIPTDRWSVDAFYDSDPLAPGKTYVRKGGFIEGVYEFDPSFFGITDGEAARMDPQQRVLLQTVWHALEDAGQTVDELANSNTGVFLAMMNTNGYSHIKGFLEGFNGINAYDAMGDAMSITAGRISHFLGIEGPCLTLDTACSSSLVALHLARQSILAGDCDMAIVAGVNIILHPAVHIAFSKLGLMSRAGRCATFDASADGYIRGEGCVAVVLRRESDAIARGDQIIASLVGTAVNQDGRTPALTAPNGRAQEKVIRTALARVGVSPNDIGYVEAHGTGTPVGDPIEMSAIVNVYGPGRSTDQELFVGSVKSNFGHIEAGAGLLGVIKTALSLHHEEIFPSIHFNQLNPNIDLGLAPVKVATKRIPWERNGSPRLAGVNSFGYSGTNAHAILQEPPSTFASPEENGEIENGFFDTGGEMVFISAKSASSLGDLVEHWIDDLEQNSNIPLHNIAFTTAVGRSHFNHRLAVTGKNATEIIQKLTSWRDGRLSKGMAQGQFFGKIKPKITFMFTGQGSQYANMGRDLFEIEPRFKASIEKIARIMDPHLGVPLLEILFGEEADDHLSNTRYVQPAIFAVEYALSELLAHWGVEPDFVIGHSIGELVAAVVAGMLNLDDAARFVVSRGFLMGSLPEGGSMLAIAASPDQVARWVEGRESEVVIATINGSHAVVVSGQGEAVSEIEEIAQTAGRRTKQLVVSHAFHSPLMDPILDDLIDAASDMRIFSPRIPIISNTSGDFFGDDVSPAYWSQQVRNAVRFYEGMEKIIDEGSSLIIEIGPQPALTPMVMTSFDLPELKTVTTLRKNKRDAENIIRSLSELYVNGIALNFDQLFWHPNYHRVQLPLYPFQREKYMIDLEGLFDVPPDEFVSADSPFANVLPDLGELHPILGKAVTRNSRKTVFENSFKTVSPWTDHRVLDSTVFPGAGYIEMVARGFAAISQASWKSMEIKDLSFESPLLLSYRDEKQISLKIEHGTNGTGGAKFSISAADGSIKYCHGKIVPSLLETVSIQLEEEFANHATDMHIGAFYGELRSRGLEYGASFATVRELRLGDSGSGEAVGRVSGLESINGHGPYTQASMLDGCLQVFGAALSTLDGMDQPGAYVPASVQSIYFSEEFPEQVWSHVAVNTNGSDQGVLATIRVFTDTGKLIAKFKNLELRRTIKFVSSTRGKDTPAASTHGNKIFQSRSHAVTQLLPLSKRDRVKLVSKWLTAEIKDTMGQAAERLNLDRLPPSTAFLEIGLDSLLITELQRRIQEKMDFRFKPMQGLDYQSIETMAEFILDDVLLSDLQKTEVVSNG